MALTSKISDYDSRWSSMFLAEKQRIAGSFGAEVAANYHIGSTAVPGLSAKPEIDILVVADFKGTASQCS